VYRRDDGSDDGNDKTMRIAMISTPFLAVPPESYGGTELLVYELAEGLIERGHDVVLFATGDSRTHAELRSLYAKAQWPPDTLIDLAHVAWAMQQAAACGCDLIHTHSALALALGRFTPALPLVYTMHHPRDATLSTFYQQYPDAWYIAISEDQRSREIPLPHLEVIHHGLDPNRYEWTDTPGDYVAFVGRFAQVKGPHTAIDAAGQAGVEIRLAGEVHSVDREFGAREVAPRLRQAHVRNLGLIGMREKVPLLRDARALLAPIEWNEPFGLILIEAMLSGCPVVAFPYGSVPELVEPGVTGCIVRSGAELAEAIRPGGAVDHCDRRRCRERAIERFSRARLVMDHEALYRRVLQSAADPPRAQVA
jgi:glycosyltransferase involved in cell wall biosynthesis